ncbi:uncharacterized protein BXZ73DRAFT_75566 [Epithele typhae]|uniref:uncharacterized protein n=1 Tax=Epithele typhae TaxID=378194 RepID=UPI0020089B09|nr:uncharacterized protein BXZ73DRAFT_75566 [Epithele typhae]KAH9940477.1 hypothetical protein BXZ73DRAFT_75566 [Epithele typhae]
MASEEPRSGSSVVSHVELTRFLGPVVISVTFNAFLYGFSVLQFMQYRSRLFTDTRLTQLLVAWTFFVDTFHTCALCWMVWTFIVDNFGNPAFVSDAPWPLAATPALVGITAMPIEIYFAHRIWTISQNRRLYWFVIVLIAATFITSITCAALVIAQATVIGLERLLPSIDAWLGLQALTEAVISYALLHYNVKSRTGFRRAETIKNKIADLFIQTSLLTSLFTVVQTITPSTNFHLLLGLPMGRVYTCCLLAMLNSQLQRQEEEADGTRDTTRGRRSYEHRVEFAKAFHNADKHWPTEFEVRVGVEIREDEIEHVRMDNLRGDEDVHGLPDLGPNLEGSDQKASPV